MAAPFLAALVLAAPAAAQQTTGSIRGAVIAGDGPVADARITVVHLPSNTVSTLTAGRDGRFAVNGLRTGGPFALTVEAPGFEQLRVAGIALAPGEPLRLPIRLAAQQEMLVAIGALRSAALRDGPVTRFDRAGIAGIGSAARDLAEIVRRAPLAAEGAVSVDGLRLPAGFARGPVPRDAIAAVSVRAAPFDVAAGAPGVDLVLRSGENLFAGSAFVARGVAGGEGRGVRDFGGFLSGAVVRDRLFFAASYERRRDDAGQAENATARIDWNAAAGQRVSLRYVHAAVPGGALDAGALQLDSDWSDTVSSETRLTYFQGEGDLAPRDGIGGQLLLRWRQGAHMLTGLAGWRRETRRRVSAHAYVAALQDSWNLSPALNLTMGARLEREAFSGDGVAVQPRLALTWQPRRRLVVRGGIGRFAGDEAEPSGAPARRAPGWRSSLSVDYTLDLGPFGDGWRFGGDLLYAEDRAGRDPRGRDPGREDQFAAVARVGTEWDFGLAASLSYTVTDDRRDPADPVPILRHAYRIALDYRRALLGGRQTHLGLFGQSVPGLFRIDLHLDQEIAAAARGRLILFADLENALDLAGAGQAEPVFAFGDPAAEQRGWGVRVGARAEF